MRIKYFVESNADAFADFLPLYYQFYWFICFSHRIYPTFDKQYPDSLKIDDNDDDEASDRVASSALPPPP